MKLWGQSLDPHSAWLIDRGMRTLAVRMERHNSNGLAVATWASAHPAIARVHYPGLAVAPGPCAGDAAARRVRRHAGARAGRRRRRAAERMLGRLQLITHAPSLAGVESLVSEPRLTSHRALGPEGRAAMGIPDGFLRLSCGLEDADDLIADLEQALDG